MCTWGKLNKYGLQEYSFEIGPMDDSDIAVAIVGLEYSSVSEDDKFYSKEDVDRLIDGKDAEVRRQKRRRCMAMAKWCFTKANYHFYLARSGENGKENIRKDARYTKWRKRWLELAEKFK